jgi:hypothetical protein
MTTSNPSNVQMYLLGGTGINIGLSVLEKSRVAVIKNSKKVALDAGGNNPSNDKFPIEHMVDPANASKELRGSGGVRALNSELVGQFIEQVITKHKPADQNIIVLGTGGGTGSKLVVTLLRKLVQLGKSVTIAIINDHTSTWETKNAIDTNMSLQNQTSPQFLNHSVVFMDFYNTEESNRGEVNSLVVDRLDHLGLIFSATSGGGSLDHQDVHNALNYSAFYKVPAAMSRIRFLDRTSAENYDGKPPVMVISLFESSDAVVPRFRGAHKRTTGVFSSEQPRPNGMTELHMVLDHGEFVAGLQEKMSAFDDQQVTTKSAFIEQKAFGAANTETGEVF